jgi:phenylalanyl-tRNA synthetase beta chain
MVGLGFTEIITYSFTSPDSADTLGAEEGSPLRSFVKILNPLTVDQSVMRTSLVPGLLATVKTNILHDEKDLKLFEWGKVFFSKEGSDLPLEKNYLVALMTGLYCQKTWSSDERYVDFYDIKGALEALLKDMGIHGSVFQKETGISRYDPGVCSSIFCSGSIIGHVGRISPGVMADYDLADLDTYLFEIDIEALLKNVSGTKEFIPFAKFPAVHRDISIIVKRHLESARIGEIIKQEGGELVESVQIFDAYKGKGIDPTEKAMAFRICYRSKHGTLDGGEINRLHESVIEKIRQETGGRLREG